MTLRLGTVFGLAIAASLVFAAPALAVDRSVGADVPKPSASGAPWSAAERAALASRLDGALASPVLRAAHVGLLAMDARSRTVLYARDAEGAFQPASTLKLLVGSATLEKLGPMQRFHTDAVAGGAFLDGTLQGPLIVRAGGDPFLTAADFDDLAAAVAGRGTHIIRGGVAFDLSRYEPEGYPPGWSWEDLAYDYAPVVGALAYGENAVRVVVEPAAAAGQAALVTVAPPSLEDPPSPCGTSLGIVAAVTTGPTSASDTVDLLRTRDGCVRVVGTIPLGGKADELVAAVPSPAVFAALALRDALRRHGVAVEGSVDANAVVVQSPSPAFVLWRHESRSLADTLGDMWIPSDNLVAELLLEELAVAGGGTPGTREKGIAYETAWLRGLGVPSDGVALADGSGLSAYDRISPRALVAILAHDWDGPYRNLVLDDLPIAGVRGTLAGNWRGTPADQHVFAKSGTLSRARTLSGYVANVRHGAIVFAFLVDEWTGDAEALRDVQGRVLSALVAG